MLNPFPILFLAPLGYAVLRLFTGFVLLLLAWRHYRARQGLAPALTFRWWPWGTIATWALIGSEGTVATSLLLGYYTQLGALLLVIMSIKLLILRPRLQHHSLPGRLTYTLLLAIGLCLIVTGAGTFAFDLPL